MGYFVMHEAVFAQEVSIVVLLCPEVLKATGKLIHGIRNVRLKLLEKG